MWGYKKGFSDWKWGQMETDFYIQKINHYNKCELQLCIYLVQEDPGWSFWRYVRHRNNQLLAEGIYKRFLLPKLVN